jgi:hypothetical protein
MTAKSKSKTKAVPKMKDRTIDDMQRYYRSLDLASLWQDFYAKINKGGRPLYTSARMLARAVGENDKQREFLGYLLGPKSGDVDLAKQFTFVEPLDFDQKRDKGGWFTEDSLKAHAKVIRDQINALDALRSAGNGITLHSFVRMEKLAQQLDEDFSGKFFVDGATLKENEQRAQLYIALHDRLLHMIGYAQDIYAKSHGINFADMSGFEKLLAAQALMIGAGQAAKESRTEKVLTSIVEMVLEKGARHGLDLPASVTGKVITMTQDVKKKTSVM